MKLTLDIFMLLVTFVSKSTSIMCSYDIYQQGPCQPDKPWPFVCDT